MSELRPPDSGDATGAPPPVDEQAPTSPEADGASAADAAPPPASAAPPPPATPPPGPGETPPPPSPPPPVDLSEAETDGGSGPDESSPPLPPPPPAPPAAGDEIEEAREVEPAGTKRSWTPVFLVLLALSVGVGGYFGFRGADDDGGTTTSTAPGAVDGFVTVQDKQAGFTVSYPETWTEAAPATEDRRLLLNAGGENSFLVRVRPVEPGAAEQAIAEAMSGVELITEPRQFDLNGVKTYYFLYYTQVSEQSPVQGVHAHYFLISGDKLYTLVFQALPTEEFTKLAPTFDKVAESFQVDNPQPAPEPTDAPSTTAG